MTTPAGRHVRLGVAAGLALALGVIVSQPLDAHGVSSKDALYLLSLDGPAIIPLMYLGAKHMVTGYDHLLFLVGVIFYLYRLRDILLYVSLFTVGHSLTLLGGALGGIRVDPYLIDAIIGLSIVYKGFENLGGFRRVLGFQPNPRVAVLIFGLFHGFGLATKLQQFQLSPNGLVENIVSFNVGVEVGQMLALTAVLLALTYWRARPGYLQHAYVTNAALMTAGFIFAGYQLAGFVIAPQ
ncbi:MAG: HupE/UreJ family protein [Acidobacteriota bacterium]|nr:HupE/UreJ family protein [Acidobacteriota bacterium]